MALKRAADLSRNTDGLFNINQVEFIDALIDAYEASGRYAEAEKESLYAMRVEEAAYGRNSIKLLDRLDKLARWYEGARRYTSERNIYERALGILAKSAPENDLRRVGPLRGIARSFRLEAFYGVEGADTGATFNSGNAGAPVFADGTQQRRGESSLNGRARHHRRQSRPSNEQLRGEVLTDLGDWYLVSNSLRRAYDTYAEAWKAFASVSQHQAARSAAHPRLPAVDQLGGPLAARPGGSRGQGRGAAFQGGSRRPHRRGDLADHRRAREPSCRNSVASMKRSRYAPRIENGVAVPTDNVVFLERVLIKVTSPDSGDVIWEGGGETGAGGAGVGGAGGVAEGTGAVATTTGGSLIGTASIVISATAAAASGEPGSGCGLRRQRLRSQQRLRHVQRRELREEFRRRIAHGRIGGDPQLFFAVADLRRGTAAVTRERQRVDQLAIRRVDQDLVADGDRASTRRRFPSSWRTRTARCAARRSPCRPGSRRAASTVSKIFASVNSALKISSIDVPVRGTELRFVVDAGARFLVHVVAGFVGDHHADLGGRRHDERLGQIAFGPHGDRRAAAEHQRKRRE